MPCIRMTPDDAREEILAPVRVRLGAPLPTRLVRSEVLEKARGDE